jgi:hypothetical protein
MVTVGYALLALLRESDDLLDPVRCDVNRGTIDRLLQTRWGPFGSCEV